LNQQGRKLYRDIILSFAYFQKFLLFYGLTIGSLPYHPREKGAFNFAVRDDRAGMNF